MAENKEGQEKTEDPTAKRLNEARDRGQVSKSQDITTAAVLLLGGLVVYLFGSPIISGIQNLMVSTFSNLDKIQITEQNATKMYTEFVLYVCKLVLPVSLLIFGIIISAEIAQVKFHFASKKFTEGLNFKSVFNPFSGIKRMFFSSRSLFELVKSFIKVSVLGLVAYQVLSQYSNNIIALADMPYQSVGTLIGKITFELLAKVSIVYAIIAVADYFYQKFKFKQDMKMTKQEVKEEYKQIQGDPKIKSRIRSLMMSRFRSMMSKNVKKADVIITNPTHVAVAISYKPGQMIAPKVVAKGVDFMAQKIKKIAKEANIPIVEEPPLARALYKNVRIDQEIPENLFKAVAQVLAYIYHLKKKDPKNS